MSFDPTIKFQSNPTNPKADLTALQISQLTKPSNNNKTRFKVCLARIGHAIKTGKYYRDADLAAVIEKHATALLPNSTDLVTVKKVFEDFDKATKGKYVHIQQVIDSKSVPWFLLTVQNTPHEFLAPYYKQANNDPVALQKLVLLATTCLDNALLQEILADFDFSAVEGQLILWTAIKSAIFNGSAIKVSLITAKLNPIEISLVKYAISQNKFEIADELNLFIDDDEMKNDLQRKLVEAMIDSRAAPSLIRKIVNNSSVDASSASKAMTNYYSELVGNNDIRGALDLLHTNLIHEESFPDHNAVDMAVLLIALGNEKTSEADALLLKRLGALEKIAINNNPNALTDLAEYGCYFHDDSESYPAVMKYFVTKNEEKVLSNVLLANVANLCGIDNIKCFEKTLEALDPNLDAGDASVVGHLMMLNNAEKAIKMAYLAGFDMNEKDAGDKSYLALVVESDLTQEAKIERILLLTSLGANPLNPFSSNYDIEDFIKSIPEKDKAIAFVQSIIEILDARIEVKGWSSISSDYTIYDQTLHGIAVDREDEDICRSAIRQGMLFELLSSKLEEAIPNTNVDDLFMHVIASEFTSNDDTYTREKILALALATGNIALAKDYAALTKDHFPQAYVDQLYKAKADEAIGENNLPLCLEILNKLSISDHSMLDLLDDLPQNMGEFVEKIVQNPKYQDLLQVQLDDGSNILHVALRKGWTGVATYLIENDPTLFDAKTQNGVYPAHYLLNQHNIPLWNKFKDRFSSLQFVLDVDPEKAKQEAINFFNAWILELINNVPSKFDNLTTQDYKVLADQQVHYLRFCGQLLDVNGEAKDEVVQLFRNLSDQKYEENQIDDFKNGTNLEQFLDNQTTEVLAALVLMRMGSTGHLNMKNFIECPMLSIKSVMPLVVLGGFKVCGKSGGQEPFMLQVIKAKQNSSLSKKEFVDNSMKSLKKLANYYPIEEIDAGLRELYTSDPDEPEQNAWQIMLDNAPKGSFTNWANKIKKDDKSIELWADLAFGTEAKEEFYKRYSYAKTLELVKEYKLLKFIGSIDSSRPDYHEALKKVLLLSIEGNYPNILKDVMAYASLSTRKVIAFFIKEGWNKAELQSIIILLNTTWQIKTSRGVSLLHTAAAAGNVSVFEKLIESGLDIQSLNSKADTVLVTAALHGQEKIVDIILDEAHKSSLDLNVALSLKKAISEATKNGHDAIAQKLSDALVA